MGDLLNGIIDLFSEPSILIGIVVFLGLLLQKKKFHETITPTLKAVVGFLVIAAASSIIVGALEPMGAMIEHGFGLVGVIPNNEAIVAVALDDFGQLTAYVMIFGMLVNILIARITNFKYIFLTGHHTLYMACMIAVILVSSGQNNLFVVLNGALALGLVMVLSPAIVQPYMRKLTGSDDIALGHFGSTGYAISGFLGSKLGNKKQSTEELNVPKNVSFLRDSTVAISITMLVIYAVCAVAAGQTFVESELSDGKNFLVFSFLQALTFTAGFIVIQTGVRMMLAEIVPAFKGISEKLVPNAKPALDVPVVFPFAPNAVVIGFLFSFIGGLVSMFLLGLLGLTIIIPGVVPHFFTGAASGVFGNATGGRRGAMIGSFANGVLISFLPVFLLPTLSGLGFQGSTFSDSDFAVLGIFLDKVHSTFGSFGMTSILIIIIFLLCIIPKFFNKVTT